jgi:hypothetical protein
VVDIDVKDRKRGFASFKHLSGCHPDDLKTWQASTPSGGRHVWFDTDKHPHFRNSVGEIAPGLDTRTCVLNPDESKSPGMVVAPPAPGRRWLGPPSIPMPAPQWLKDQFVARIYAPPAPSMVAHAHTPEGLLALLNLCERIRTAPVSWRDKSRTKYAFVAGQLVGGGELEETSAWVAVLQAARAQLKRTAKEANESRRKEKYLEGTFRLGITRPRRCSDFGVGGGAQL